MNGSNEQQSKTSLGKFLERTSHSVHVYRLSSRGCLGTRIDAMTSGCPVTEWLVLKEIGLREHCFTWFFLPVRPTHRGQHRLAGVVVAHGSIRFWCWHYYWGALTAFTRWFSCQKDSYFGTVLLKERCLTFFVRSAATSCVRIIASAWLS